MELEIRRDKAWSETFIAYIGKGGLDWLFPAYAR